MNNKELNEKINIIYELADKKLKEIERIELSLNKKELDIQCELRTIESRIDHIEDKIEEIVNNKDSQKKEIIEKELLNLLAFIKEKSVEDIESCLREDW